MELDVQHSATRLAYIKARIENSLVSNEYTASAFPSSTGRTILANISIGQPPTPQLVIMDTASDILWVMCAPCSNCDHHSGQLFDPSKSSTYSPLCNTPCDFKGCKCDPLPFRISYVDSSSASGTYGHDMVLFETTDEGTSQMWGVLFGCGHNIGYNRDPGYNGILGLNYAPSSLATQIGQGFSYCIGNLADQYYSYNQLILGEGADLEGYSTPFQVHYGFYYVTMEGISVGERRLDIAPETFEIKEDGTGGAIIDTGCTLTYLVDGVHELLYREVRNLLGKSFRQAIFENTPWMLCYYGSISRDLVGFPVVTFHFSDGADLALDSGSFFHQFNDKVFCMTIGPVNDLDNRSKPSVIGLLAQQSYNVGYDLDNHLVYFQRIDCELLSG
uniref:Aspartic proteinase nepenthesin-1 n=2 Tax=Cajanus cajan TaxID=3821 RepID=A0A151T5G2_CAJCA|nr:Aspartic proteinase nepenthesin-1 [Cajanus cajan]